MKHAIDAHTKGGSLESGTSEKAKITETPEALGQGSVGPNPQVDMPGNKPAPNPSVKAGKGHTIK